MDFEAVSRFIISQFDKQKVRVAIIGGFALHVAGLTRATLDVDFLVHQQDVPKVKSILNGLGYDCRHESQDAINFFGKLDTLGGIDFIIAHRRYALAMLERAKPHALYKDCVVNVVVPEDIIGLKLQALHNDPTRKPQDLADIQWLVSHYKDKLDKDLLKEYFQLFNDQKLLDELIG